MSELIILGMTLGAFVLGGLITRAIDWYNDLQAERAKKSPNNPKYDKWREEV